MATSESPVIHAPDQEFLDKGDTYQVDGDSEASDLTKDDMVPFTSRLIAAARAIESQRSDRLFSDCFAELLAGEEAMHTCVEHLRLLMRNYEFGSHLEENNDAVYSKAGDTYSSQSVECTGAPTNGDDFSRQLAIRIRYFDDFFKACTSPPRNIKQVVLLGAGMDTRGYRLRAGPDTTVFEVDQALVLSFKKKVLSGTSTQKMISDKKMDGCEARVIEVGADLEKTGWEGKLVEAGFDPALPSAWILEGLIMYFEENEIAKLLQIISSLCSSGSALCASTLSAEWLERSKSVEDDTFRFWKWGSDDPQTFFKDHLPGNWSLRYVTIGTPGEFPDGADYSLEYKGRGRGCVVGDAAVNGGK